MVLVVQFREDVTREHEQECIVRHVGADREVRFVSVFEEEWAWRRPHELLFGVSKVIFGGSGVLSMADGHGKNDYAKVEYILRTVEPLVKFVIDEDFPTLGTCFGHQLLGHFAGGRVVFDPDMAESGFEVIRVKDEDGDPLLRQIEQEFWAVVGHEDTVVDLPREVSVLASSVRCENHMLKIGNNVYGTQFHSELTAEDHAFRVKKFPHYNQYALNHTPMPTPHAVKLLDNFLSR